MTEEERDDLTEVPPYPRLSVQFFDVSDYERALALVMWVTRPREQGPRPPVPKCTPEQDAYLKQAISDWEEHGFLETERDAYMANGVLWHEAELAERCVRYGIAPEELSLTQHGRTMLDYLRSGESVGTVYARIREVA